MPYALGELALENPTVWVDEFGNPIDLTPTVTITPGSGGQDTLPPPDFTPESPRTAPQPLPDLIATASPPRAAGTPWWLLLALLGGYAVLSGKGRGTQDFR